MLDKLKNKFYDLIPTWLYCFYMENVRLTGWKNKYKKFLRDKQYGFNTDETFELDMAFYKWISPRLRYYKKVNNGYPNGKTWEGWCKELDDNITKLDLILQFDEDPWLCPDDYVTKDDMAEFRKKYGKVIDSGYLNQRSYENCRKSFNEWFGENINNLWW